VCNIEQLKALMIGSLLASVVVTANVALGAVPAFSLPPVQGPRPHEPGPLLFSCQHIGPALCFALQVRLVPEGIIRDRFSSWNHQNQNRSLSSGCRIRTNFIAPLAGTRLRPSGMVALRSAEYLASLQPSGNTSNASIQRKSQEGEEWIQPLNNECWN
jgi:hypothetical protein